MTDNADPMITGNDCTICLGHAADVFDPPEVIAEHAKHTAQTQTPLIPNVVDAITRVNTICDAHVTIDRVGIHNYVRILVDLEALRVDLDFLAASHGHELGWVLKKAHQRIGWLTRTAVSEPLNREMGFDESYVG